MMKILICVLIFFFAIPSPLAAEYTVKPGDTLWVIGNEIGFSRKQLMKMNDLKNENHIRLGQKLAYYTKDDLKYATLWCKKRIKELEKANEDYSHYETALSALEKRLVRFSLNDPFSEGVYFKSLLLYSDAWKAGGGK